MVEIYYDDGLGRKTVERVTFTPIGVTLVLAGFRRVNIPYGVDSTGKMVE